MIIEAIKNNETALAAATAGDWSACAQTLRSITVTAVPRLCFSVETSLAILAVGGDPNEIMEVMNKDATGQFLMTKLATVGVMWAHPLTIAYLDAAVAANGLGKLSRDAAVNLSAPVIIPFAEVTPEQCAAAYLVGADVLLSVNRTGGQLRMSMNVSRDGKQVRVASLTEGQGSVNDQSLTTSIRSAIDAWLVGG